MPLFAVIIPVHNTAPYLKDCLDSILAQDCADWECLCVDDGSTDGSGDILDGYASRDSRFRIVHQENAGPGAARNKGLGLARGEWVSFVDSDDMLRPDCLSSFAKLPDKTDITFFQLTRIDGDGIRHNFTFPADWTTEPTTSGPEMEKMAARLIFNSRHADMFGWTCNKFIRRSLIEKTGARFDVSVQCYEDELFALGLLKAARSIRLLPRCLYLYRWREGCLTASRERNAKGLAERYEKALEGFADETFLSLQFLRVFHLLEAEFAADPSSESLARLSGFRKRHRRFLRFRERRQGILLGLAAALPRRLPGGIVRLFRRLLPAPPTPMLWTANPGEKPIPIDTFFV